MCMSAHMSMCICVNKRMRVRMYVPLCKLLYIPKRNRSSPCGICGVYSLKGLRCSTFLCKVQLSIGSLKVIWGYIVNQIFLAI